MEKVRCTRCGNIGYTAAPNFVRCHECGGEHEILEMDRENPRISISAENLIYFIEALSSKASLQR